jgi:hypothetical protein
MHILCIKLGTVQVLHVYDIDYVYNLNAVLKIYCYQFDSSRFDLSLCHKSTDSMTCYATMHTRSWVFFPVISESGPAASLYKRRRGQNTFQKKTRH